MTTTLTPQEIADQELEQRLKDDFRVFLWALWKHLNLPNPTPVQADIARYLQHGPRRRIIEAFRGVGKSWITVAYVLWRLYKDPQLRVLCVSATEEHASDLSTFLLLLIEQWPLVAHLKPPPNRSSKMAFDVGPAKPAKARSVRSVGIFGQLQGPRADLILADDIETLGNAETPGKRAKLEKVTAEFDSIIVPGGEIIYLGTPQYEDSLYNKLYSMIGEDEDGDTYRLYDCRIWPALFPEEADAAAYGDRLAPYIKAKLEGGASVGSTTDPARFSNQDLAERKVRYGNSGFRLQFMLDTTVSDENRFPLHLTDLIVMPLDHRVGPDRLTWGPTSDNEHKDIINVGRNRDRYHGPALGHTAAYMPYTESILVIDPSGRGSDETAWCVLKSLNGQFFVCDLGADTRGYDELVIEKMAETAKTHSCTRIVYESNFGDGMFEKIAEPIFNRIHPCTFEGVRSNTQKERRIIDTLEPVMNSHRLVIDKAVVERDHDLTKGYDLDKCLYYSLFYQMSRLTNERGCLAHDDRLDCVAMGVAYFQEQAAIDTAVAAADARHQANEQWIEDWERRNGITGHSDYRPSRCTSHSGRRWGR